VLKRDIKLQPTLHTVTVYFVQSRQRSDVSCENSWWRLWQPVGSKATLGRGRRGRWAHCQWVLLTYTYVP